MHRNSKGIFEVSEAEADKCFGHIDYEYTTVWAMTAEDLATNVHNYYLTGWDVHVGSATVLKERMALIPAGAYTQIVARSRNYQ